MQNFTARDALIADFVEAAALPTDLADITAADRVHLDRFARRLHVLPAAALAIARASQRESVERSRFTATVAAEGRATAHRY